MRTPRHGPRPSAHHPGGGAARGDRLGIRQKLVVVAFGGRGVLVGFNRLTEGATGSPAVFLALFIHSLFYAGFFEDPIVWGVMALAGWAYVVLPPTPRSAAVADAGERSNDDGPGERETTAATATLGDGWTAA